MRSNHNVCRHCKALQGEVFLEHRRGELARDKAKSLQAAWDMQLHAAGDTVCPAAQQAHRTYLRHLERHEQALAVLRLHNGRDVRIRAWLSLPGFGTWGEGVNCMYVHYIL